MHSSMMILLMTACARQVEPSGNVGQDERTAAFVNGDFIIGMLFPIHHQPATKQERSQSQGIKCGNIRELYGIQRVEVAMHTIDKINSDVNLLPNVTIGVEIRDDCWYAPVALQQSIELIRDAIVPISSHNINCPNVTNGQPAAEVRGHLIGVVGPASSSVALQVQNLLQLFHLPQIGYSTTSKDLSDKSRFNYFLRVVPSDYYQAQVMLDIVRSQGWTYVSAVNTDENYGQAGIQAFRELAEEADVCIAREDSVLSNAADEVFDKVIINLKQDPNAVVVICFCEGLTVRGLLRASKRLNMTNKYLFIGSDGWADRGDVTVDLEPEAWGSLSVRIHSPYIVDFDDYYWALKPYTNARNPWFNEFWQYRFSCSFQKQNQEDTRAKVPPLLPSVASVATPLHVIAENTTSFSYEQFCTGEEQLSDKYRQDSKLSFVIKAIYSMAYALHAMHQDVCGEGFAGVCDKLMPFNGSLFKSYLLNVSFDYAGDMVEFDENGDPPGRYDIMNFQKADDGSYDYIQVGDWNNKSLVWVRAMQFGSSVHVKSVCSQPCALGHYKNIQQGGKDKRCCWVCVRCPSGEILDEESDTNCKKCPLGYIPNTNQTDCLLLPIEYMQWNDTQAIVAMSFAILGFLVTWFSFAVFVKYNNTPVVKSSTKELSYIILAGMTLSHGSIFPILAKPGKLSCALSRFLPGLSFAMIYAALLTKTNRIARILAGSKKRFPTRKRLFMSSASQVVISSLLIGIEVLISLWMLYYEPPNIARSYYATRTVLGCDTTPQAVTTPLAFNFFLILLCTLYALKTRNVPENFNEAKFIGFSMYTTCVIWVAFVPIYFGSDSKVITMCMCVTLSALVIWIFLFIPKLYIIMLRPDRNNRSFFTTSKSIRCHIGSRVATALSEKSSVNSWKESSGTVKEIVKDVPQKRTLSCQTGVELLQVLLSPKTLMDTCSPPQRTFVPRITERDCCQADSCQFKKITIRLPDSAITSFY